MVCVLGHQHLGQQACGRDALVDDLRGHWCLNQCLDLGAGPFAANVVPGCEQAGCVVQLLADIFANALQGAGAAAARCGAGGGVGDSMTSSRSSGALKFVSDSGAVTMHASVPALHAGFKMTLPAAYPVGRQPAAVFHQRIGVTCQSQRGDVGIQPVNDGPGLFPNRHAIVQISHPGP